jgi:hypothetical protein
VILIVAQSFYKENNMTKSTILTTAITALFLISLGVNSGLAAKDNGKSKTGGMQTEKGSKKDSKRHMGIKTGKDFNTHVRGHVDRFSGDHNPGKHRGFSPIKSN